MITQTEIERPHPASLNEERSNQAPAVEVYRPNMDKALDQLLLASYLVDVLGIEIELEKFSQKRDILDPMIVPVTTVFNRDMNDMQEGQEQQSGEYVAEGVLAGYALQWVDPTKPLFRNGERGEMHYTVVAGITDLTDYNAMLLFKDSFPPNELIYDSLRSPATFPVRISAQKHTKDARLVHIPLVSSSGEIIATNASIQHIQQKTRVKLNGVPEAIIPLRE